MMRLVTLGAPAEEGMRRIKATIARQKEPELQDVVIIRNADDIDPGDDAAFPAVVLSVVLRSAVTVAGFCRLDHARRFALTSCRAGRLCPLDVLLDAAIDRLIDVPHRQVIGHDGAIAINLALATGAVRHTGSREFVPLGAGALRIACKRPKPAQPRRR